MSGFSVKKPLTVIMALLMVIVLGYVSFSNMKTDLLPNMDLPYVAIITTYPGAAPEKVEATLTKPLEQTLATTSGVENIASISSENYSAIILEFSSKTNLDSAMIEMSGKASAALSAMDSSVGSPIYMKINPDLLPVIIASVDIEGLDRKDIAKKVEEDIIPQFERLDGVASVSAVGLIENTMKITIDQEKIDKLNDEIIKAVDEKLLDAEKELDEAEKKLKEGKETLEKTKSEQNESLATATVSIQAGMTQITVVKTALDTALPLLDSTDAVFDAARGEIAKAKKNTDNWPDYRKPISDRLQDAGDKLSTAKDTIDGVIDALDEHTDNFEKIKSVLSDASEKLGKWAEKCKSTAKQVKSSKTASEALKDVSKLIDSIEGEFDDFKSKLNDTATELSDNLERLKDQQTQLEAGKLKYSQEMAKADREMAEAEEKLSAGKEQLDAAKNEAYEKAGLSGAITVDTISSLISAENFSMPVGSVSEDNIAYSVKVGNLFEDNTELLSWEMFNIPLGDIGAVTIEDIADIEYLDNSDSMYAKINGNNGIMLTFEKQSTYSTTEVAHTIQDKMKSLEKEYEGFSITPLSDQGEYIDLVIDSVLEALIMGGILAMLILLVFLMDFRPTFIIAISIPASLLFAIVLMYFTGVSLNIISLAGLALGVGMLVDNSIVVVENIYRLKALGMPIKQAAIDGAKQVGGAIIASTLTTVSVFVPILFTNGITKQIFSDMGLTIAYSLLASLIVALTLVPALSSMMLKKTKEKQPKLFGNIINGYAKLLSRALDRKAVVIIIVIALMGLSIFGVTQMGTEFIPESDTKQMALTLELPLGKTSEDARAMSEEVIDRLSELKDIETIAAMQGGSGYAAMLSAGGNSDRTVSMYILLKDKRSVTSQEMSDIIMEKLKDLDCNVSVASASMNMNMLTGEGLEVVIKGTDLDDLQKSAKDIGEIIEGIDGTYDIVTGMEEVAQEIRIIVDKNAAMAKGYTVAQVYMKVAEAIKTESTATTLDINDDEYSVVISKGAEDKVTANDLANIELEVSNDMSLDSSGSEPETVKLKDIASIEFADTLRSISHQNQVRKMSVTAAVDSSHNIGKVSRELENKLKDYKFPGDCYYETSGENEYITSALRDLVYMVLIAVAFIYMIMVAQFQSLKSPFIVMFTIPLAFTGGILLLWALGFNLSVVAMLGLLVLSGVVVNNGIVFVDYANKLIEDGMEMREALIETGRARIRPIIMTAITTILGLTTIALAIGEGTDMVQPMAIVVIGGLLYATVLTLFVIPALYEIFNKKHAKKSKRSAEAE